MSLILLAFSFVLRLFYAFAGVWEEKMELCNLF